MRVISKKIGEQIWLNDGVIIIKMLALEDGVVCIGFTAPAYIEIDREEVRLRKIAKRNMALSLSNLNTAGGTSC